MTVECENGLYPASDTTTNMSGSYVKDVLYKNKSLGITSWRYYFNAICKITSELDFEKFRSIVADNVIHKSQSKYQKNIKDPIISMDKTLLVEPKKIGNTDIYSEGSLSSERARVYAKQLLDIFKITDDIQILVERREE